MFQTIREDAVSKWAATTKRQGCGLDENYADSIECVWQTRAINGLGYCHISLFCSLADWACNMTDVLTDHRFDAMELLDANHSQVLSRFYTRVLLVASEVFGDLEQLAVEAGRCKDQTSARTFLSPDTDPGWINNLHHFINRICKHKFKNLHQCNHHLPICFEDQTPATAPANPIRLGNVDIEGGDAIQFPRLISICDAICVAYRKIDEVFQADEDVFKRICDRFNDPSCTDEEPEEA
jgi:hypothetical protein